MKLYKILESFVGSQTGAEVEVPPLSEILGSLSGIQIEALEGDVSTGAGLTEDIDIAIEQAVSEAVAEGVITQEQAADAAASLAIVNANAEFFDFDILDAMGDAIEQGLSIEEVRLTLESFNSLSDAGKAIVGQNSFTGSGDSYNALSDSDKAIVDAMPVFQDS